MDIYPFVSQISEWLGVLAVAMLAGISPRFTRRPLVFRYPARERTFALAVAIFAIIAAFIFWALVKPSSDSNSIPPLPRLILAALCALPVIGALRLRGQPVRSAGWGSQTLRPAVYLGLAAGVLAVFLRGRMFNILNGVNSDETLGLLIWLGVCLAEETVFRGYILLRLTGAWGAWRGSAASALIFTLFSLPLRLAAAPETNALLLSLLITFVQGLLLAYLMNKSGHVLAPALYRAMSEWISMVI